VSEALDLRYRVRSQANILSQEQQTAAHPITTKSDVWGIGKIMLALITITPYDEVQQCVFERPTTFPQLPEEYKSLYPPDMVELMMQCLKPEPSERPT
jgi:hypothetical protein